MAVLHRTQRLAPPLGILATTILGALLPTACSEASTDPDGKQMREAKGPVRRAGGKCMGTSWNALWFGGPEDLDGAKRIIERLDAFEDVLSTWRPDSEISRFNKSESTDPIEVSEELFLVALLAQRISKMTEGAFDITVGPLYTLYQRVKDGEPVTPEEWAVARERVGYQKLECIAPETPEGNGSLRKLHPSLTLDVSAIAKGAGSDAVAKLLWDLGAAAAMVEIGGEVHAFGARPGGIKWRLGVEDPEAGAEGRGKEPLDVVWLGGAYGPTGLATSGSYRNFVARDDIGRLHHIFDPRTGENAEHRTVSVSVKGLDCAAADALATALMVVGSGGAASIYGEGEGGWSALLVDAPDRFGEPWKLTKLGWD